MGNTPYWRLSGFYLFYFASLGALVPYWGLYLKQRGFGAVEIGELMAVIMATKVIAPNIWGWIADHTGRRMAIVRMASWVSVVIFAGVFVDSGYWWLMLVMAGFSFFWNASLPQFEAVTLNYLGSQSHRYGHIRLWGSVGFIATVAGLGPLMVGEGVSFLPWVLLGLFAAIWFSSRGIEDAGPPPHHREHPSLGAVLRRPEVIALLLVCFLMQASHGPYYTFYTLYLDEYGYSGGAIGWLWALGVIAEIGVFMVIHRLLPWIGAHHLLWISLALTAVRWALIGLFVETQAVIWLAQLFHAASFGGYHAAAIHLINQHFVGRNQGRGQALYSSLSFGAGGAVGSLYSGYVWEMVSPQLTFLIGAVMAAVAVLITWIWVRPRSVHAVQR